MSTKKPTNMKDFFGMQEMKSMDISDEYLSFQNNFGEGVSQIQANFLSGTIFKYNSFAIKKPENETSNKTLNDF